MTSRRYTPLTAPVLVFAAAVALSSEALAGCDIPFLITTVGGGDGTSIFCTGPWARESKCADLKTNESEVQFYCASETITSAAGKWKCQFILETCKEGGSGTINLPFCLELSLFGTFPNPVKLTLTAEDPNPPVFTVNAPTTCFDAATVSFLGHTSAGTAKAPRTIGRGRPSGVRGGPGGDRDTFAFEGEGGEVVKVTLEGEGTSGHTGDAARLRIQVQGGVVLDEKTGSLPLETEVTLPDTGTVEIVVEETSGGERFRGHYLLRVAPDGGADDLLLDPQPDVEP